MAKETFAEARARLYEELRAKGWIVSKPDLKVPWAMPRSRKFKLSFKPQAIYKDEHSTLLDMRGLNVDALIAYLGEE